MDIATYFTANVGTPPDFRTTPGGMPAASFRAAVTSRIFRNGQWSDGTTTWVTVTCSWALAENVRDSVRKSDSIIVVGKLKTQTWLDAQGANRERVVVEATAIGHDLTRGTAHFTRAQRREDPRPAPEEQSDEYVGAAPPDAR